MAAPPPAGVAAQLITCLPTQIPGDAPVPRKHATFSSGFACKLEASTASAGVPRRAGGGGAAWGHNRGTAPVAGGGDEADCEQCGEKFERDDLILAADGSGVYCEACFEETDEGRGRGCF